MRHIGVSLNGSNNTLRNSIIDDNKFGVGVSGDHQTVTGNYISNHYSRSSEAPAPWKGAASQFWDGIVSEGLTNSLLAQNTVEDNGQSGIYTGGNGSLSHGNRIVRNVVRWNWNRGIDQGVTGFTTRSNGVGEIIIQGNTIVDNRAGNLWLLQVIGATVTENTIETTPNYKTLFRSQAVEPVTSRPDIALAILSRGQSTSGILFAGNTVSTSSRNPNCLSLNMGSGEGNMVGNNKRSSNCGVYLSSLVDLTKNAIAETGTTGNADFIGWFTLNANRRSGTLPSKKAHAGSNCFSREVENTTSSSSQFVIHASNGYVTILGPTQAYATKLSIWCTRP
jgi:hypothetical protein